MRAMKKKYYYHPFTKHESGFSADEKKEEKESQDTNGANGIKTEISEAVKKLQEQLTLTNPEQAQRIAILNTAKRATSTKREERKPLENHLFREGSGQELLERYKSHFKFMDFNHNGSDYIKNLINMNLRRERTSFVNVKLNAVREFWQIPLSVRATQVLGKPLPMDERLKTFDFSTL